MSMPNIPDIKPNVTITRENALNVILSSIGMEELSLAHILNAEGEKMQFALGTLESADGKAATMEQILELDRTASKKLRDVIKNQMLIGMKMEDVVSLVYQESSSPTGPTGPTNPTGPTGETGTTGTTGETLG